VKLVEPIVRLVPSLAERPVMSVAVVIDPSSFLQDASAIRYERATRRVVTDLVASRIPTYLVRNGDPLEVALSEANAQAA